MNFQVPSKNSVVKSSDVFIPYTSNLNSMTLVDERKLKGICLSSSPEQRQSFGTAGMSFQGTSKKRNVAEALPRQ